MEEPKASFWQACAGTERDRHNRRRIALWNLAWGITWIGVTAGIKFGYIPTGTMAILTTLLPAALSVKVILAYHRYLREADELQRKIELDALAMAVGVGIFGGLTYWLLLHAGAFEEADLLVTPVLMMFTHGIGVWIGKRRYA